MPSTGDPVADFFLYAFAFLTAVAGIAKILGPFLKGMWRVLRIIEQGATDYTESGGFGGLSKQIEQVRTLAERSHKELHPNGGSSLRDAVDLAASEARRAVTEAERVGHITEDLRGLRHGINELRQGQATVDQRIADHRRRNDEATAEIRKFLSEKYGDAIEAAEHLRAAVTEMLLVRDEEPIPHTRSTDPETPDPDL